MQNTLQYLKEILTLLGANQRKLPMMVILFLLASLLDLAGLGLIAPYISLVLNPEKLDTASLGSIFRELGLKPDWESLVLLLGFVLALIYFCKAISNLWIQYKIISFSQQQQVQLRTYLMQAYQHLPYQDYLRRNSSEYSHSIQTLVPSYGGVVSTLLKVVCDVLVASMIILVLAWQNILILGLLLSLLGGLILVYDRSFRQQLREYGKRNNEAHHQVVQNLHEAVDGFKEIRILGKENYFYTKLKEGAKWNAHYEIRKQLLNLMPGYLLEFVLVAFVVSTLSMVIWLGENLTEIVPIIGVFGVAALRLKPTATSLASSLIILRFQRDSIRRLYDDVKGMKPFDIPATPKQSTKKNTEPFHELRLTQANFCYDGTVQTALENASLHIEVGETIGLVGPSGSGKTTLVDVLLGLLKPHSGTLEFNGNNVYEALHQWTSQVAYLPQQVFLVDNSLKNNVTLGEEEHEIDESRLKEALRQACLTELVEQLPQGINTLLGERGVRLSGGQRQRVALARAFYHGRNVLIMDEATSALDNETERAIVEEIQRLKGQKTMIVIAHRLSTVKHCDRIYRLERGRIVKVGPPQEILSGVS